MRREILVVRTGTNDPADWEANRIPLGPQAVVRGALARVFGEGTWQGPDQGIFDGPGFSLLAKLGIAPTVETLTLEVWGQSDPTRSIKDLCTVAGWHAVDLDTWQPLLFADAP